MTPRISEAERLLLVDLINAHVQAGKTLDTVREIIMTRYQLGPTDGIDLHTGEILHREEHLPAEIA